MSTLETILSRAMSDRQFAEQLFTNPEKVLAEYHLSEEEVGMLKGLSRAQFESMTPEERKSFVFIGTANGGVWKTTDGR